MSARIVVADDETDVRRLIVFTLQRRGYTVFEAKDGDAALALIRQELPDLVVLDVMMPGVSGLEVARSLAREPATAAIPVLMLSARGQIAEIEAGLASGVSAYVVKPFVPKELATRVAEILASRQEDSPI